MDDVCVFVSSSDRTRDIFEIVFRDSGRTWQDCDWPRYVGFTSQAPLDTFGFTPVFARGGTGWRGELFDQINSLPPTITFILLLLDDFLLLADVSSEKLRATLERIRCGNYAYLRLVPVQRSLLGKSVERARRAFSRQEFRRLSRPEPYYSSLQAAIWRRDHLQSLLSKPGAIWDFEHMVDDTPNYAVWRPVLKYRHVVERGKWLPCAITLFGGTLDLGKRGTHPVKSRLTRLRQEAVFLLFGYLSLRLRRRLGARLWRS